MPVRTRDPRAPSTPTAACSTDLGCIVEDAEPDFAGVAEAFPTLRFVGNHATYAPLVRAAARVGQGHDPVRGRAGRAPDRRPTSAGPRPASPRMYDDSRALLRALRLLRPAGDPGRAVRHRHAVSDPRQRRGDGDLHRLDAVLLVRHVDVHAGHLGPGGLHAGRAPGRAADRRPASRRLARAADGARLRTGDAARAPPAAARLIAAVPASGTVEVRRRSDTGGYNRGSCRARWSPASISIPSRDSTPSRVDAATVLPSGALAGDRRWAFVDERDRFVNGKQFPAIHRIRARVDPDASTAVVDDQHFLLAGDTTPLEDWMSARLGTPVRLHENPTAGFPDDTDAPGPTLIATATLEAVGAWFDLTLEETRVRFRANIEIGGVPAFWEDAFYGGLCRIGRKPRSHPRRRGGWRARRRLRPGQPVRALRRAVPRCPHRRTDPRLSEAVRRAAAGDAACRRRRDAVQPFLPGGREHAAGTRFAAAASSASAMRDRPWAHASADGRFVETAMSDVMTSAPMPRFVTADDTPAFDLTALLESPRLRASADRRVIDDLPDEDRDRLLARPSPRSTARIAMPGGGSRLVQGSDGNTLSVMHDPVVTRRRLRELTAARIDRRRSRSSTSCRRSATAARPSPTSTARSLCPAPPVKDEHRAARRRGPSARRSRPRRSARCTARRR